MIHMTPVVLTCPQYTDYYCPHYKHNKTECDDATNKPVTCVHVKAARQAEFALFGVMALADALGRKDVLNSIKSVAEDKTKDVRWQLKEFPFTKFS